MTDTTQAWIGWEKINKFSWNYFLTLTFPNKANIDKANKTWRYFANRLARQELPAGRARKEGLPWISAIEYSKDDSAHVHALLKTEMTPEVLKELWCSIAGGNIHVMRYEPKMLNYLVKEANSGNIDVSYYFKEKKSIVSE